MNLENGPIRGFEHSTGLKVIVEEIINTFPG